MLDKQNVLIYAIHILQNVLIICRHLDSYFALWAEQRVFPWQRLSMLHNARVSR